MIDREKQDLIKKYLEGNASEQETKALLSWYRQHQQDEIVWHTHDLQEPEQIRLRMKDQLQSKLHLNQSDRMLIPNSSDRKRQRTWAIAASLTILLGISAVLFYTVFRGKNNENLYVNQIESTEKGFSANRFVMLPDSSKVILSPGSRLEIQSDFDGTSREVRLLGEGYFDVEHDKSRPFIVHTGNLKTIVLGTAFTIRNEGTTDQIHVTVQRGKVRVENENTVLAELTANEQLNFDSKNFQNQKKEVVAEQVANWALEPWRLDAIALGEVVNRLRERYDVEIAFADQGLADYKISGQLEGSETLDEVLRILCTTAGMQYRRLDDGGIRIETNVRSTQ